MKAVIVFNRTTVVFLLSYKYLVRCWTNLGFCSYVTIAISIINWLWTLKASRVNQIIVVISSFFLFLIVVNAAVFKQSLDTQIYLQSFEGSVNPFSFSNHTRKHYKERNKSFISFYQTKNIIFITVIYLKCRRNVLCYFFMSCSCMYSNNF